MLVACRAAVKVAAGVLDLIKRAVILSPVLLVFAIVLADWTTFVFLFMAQIYDAHPLYAITCTAAFTATALLALISYMRCVLTSNCPCDNPAPGHVDLSDCRRCAKCSSLKPDRAHHCSMCGKCCLKMDHHCPWIANCVGHYNYKYFLLFLFWCCTGCLVYVVSVGKDLVSVFHVAPSKHFTLELIALFSVISSIAFGLTLLGFTAFHLHLVFLNQTTLEYGFIRSNLNPYDQGWRKNFQSIFGHRKRYWLLPVDTLQVTGWEYIESADESRPISATVTVVYQEEQAISLV